MIVYWISFDRIFLINDEHISHARKQTHCTDKSSFGSSIVAIFTNYFSFCFGFFYIFLYFICIQSHGIAVPLNLQFTTSSFTWIIFRIGMSNNGYEKFMRFKVSSTQQADFNNTEFKSMYRRSLNYIYRNITFIVCCVS